MIKKITLYAAVIFTGWNSPFACQAIDITPSSGVGPSALDLAKEIADEAGGVTVDISSVTTAINNPNQNNPDSDPRAMGTFGEGMTDAGISLPTANGGPAETYAGGLDIDTGVCLCTGVVGDSLATAGANLGFGMEGPNNGDGEGVFNSQTQGGTVNHTGEITTRLFINPNGTFNSFIDQDFEDEAFPDDNPGGGDPTVLKFDVVITEAGFLRISFVFGSDEFPFYVNAQTNFNDSVAIIIDGENIATTTMNSVATPFNLFDISECPQLFVKNDTAPNPAILT